MESPGEASLEALEMRAKLQVRVHRTILRHQLIMIGNVLLVAFLFAALVLLLWTLMVGLGAGQPLLAWAGAIFGTSDRRMLQLSMTAMASFKLAAILLFLCPGLAFRICGSAMQP